MQANGAGAKLLTAEDANDATVLFLVLGGIALVYAFLAGLRTLADPDLGWQMATGRWIVQHHRIFSTDVFSYTATGAPWIYPVASGLLFYVLYLIGGYALLSCFGAASCAATVGLLLRRGSASTAAIAIVAIPLISQRMSPRAEIFTVLLFAGYLSLLWENYQTGRARLLWLPLLMIAWVNLHLGFIAGLVLIAGFIGLDVLELLLGKRRRSAAWHRLKRASPYYAATALATLINPWGWKLYQAIVRQNRVMKEHAQYIAEWASAHWHWHGAIGTFLQDPMQYTLALVTVVVIVAGLAALLQLQPGAAILLVGALGATLRYVRMEGLTACVVVVFGGAMLSAAGRRIGGWIPMPRLRSALAIAATVAFAALAVVRAADFVSDQVYITGRTDFGAGLTWWFPQRAAEFVNRENLPPEVFNSFNEGGYMVWALGQKYRDYVDGRSVPFGLGIFERERELLVAPLDSPRWQQEAEKYNINTMVLQLNSEEVAFDRLPELCTSENWRPVYLDEAAIVLVRRRPETEKLIDRLQISCASAAIPANALDDSNKSFQRWLNSAYILLALRRNAEALSAADHALKIFSASYNLHAIRGNILYANSRRVEAEQEWLKALSMSRGGNDAAIWSELGRLYVQQDRGGDAVYAWQQAFLLTSDPVLRSQALVQLARLYLARGDAKTSLEALDQAVRQAPAELLEARQGRSFNFDIAQGRAASWKKLGDLRQATSFQEQAVKLDPDAADAWSYLAKLYAEQGRIADQHRAEKRAKSLGTNETR